MIFFYEEGEDKGEKEGNGENREGNSVIVVRIDVELIDWLATARPFQKESNERLIEGGTEYNAQHISESHSHTLCRVRHAGIRKSKRKSVGAREKAKDKY